MSETENTGGMVQHSAELERIIRLPRRVWTPADLERLVAEMSAAHRTTHGTQTLRPLQAQALAEAVCWKGATVWIPVGGGKTLVSGLLPRMFRDVKRPLILVPSALVRKTEEELQAYRKDWVLPGLLKVKGYQALSRVEQADFLDAYCPDLIVADEADFLKNESAAVTRRVRRYRRAHPECVFVPMSGTPWDRSILEIAHLTFDALPRTNPLPATRLAADEWSRALDSDVAENRRLAPGALQAFARPDEEVRSAFQRRFYETPGVIMSLDPPLAIPLEIRSHVVPTDSAQDQAFAQLRKTWKTPDGIDVEDGVAMWRHTREIATGFYSVWDPRAPTDWREARSAWARECREVLATNRRQLDSELQLCNAIDAHPEWYPLAGILLNAWREIAPTFKPNPVPVWISDRTLEWVAEWAAKSPGLIWTDRPAVGERLAAKFGIPYYGEMGINAATGRYVEAHLAREGSIVLSRPANDTGRNLQYQWSRNLVIDVMPSGRKWEQCIGRSHRPGQEAERVTFDLLVGCVEDATAFDKAFHRNVWAQTMSGQARKLPHATVVQVLDAEDADDLYHPETGAQWRKSRPPSNEP